jgi:hypothetical protein
MLGTKQPLFSALLDEYQLWNGRYTSNVFVLKNPLVFRDSWWIMYRLALVGISLFTLFSFYVFFANFLKNNATKKQLLLVSLLAYVLNLFQMPILSEGTYWYTGVVTYQLANCFTLFYLIGLHRFLIYNSKISTVFLFCILFTACILIAGFNEVIMLLFLVFHFVLAFIYYVRKQLMWKWVVGLFIASIIGFCFVYFAPGNKVREAYFVGESHRFIHSLTFTFLQTLRFGFSWISSGVLILLSLVYLPISARLSLHIPLFQHNFYLNKWVTLFALFGVLFLAIFPAYWSTGMMGQHRTVNTAYFYFILLWFVNLTVWSKTSFFSKIQVPNRLQRYALIVSLLLLVGSSNTFSAWKDLVSGDASAFNSELLHRYQLLDKISKKTNVLQELPMVKTKPRSIFVYDITKDPKYFPNTCYKSYWKLQSYIIGK